MRLAQRRKEGLFYFTAEQCTASLPGAEVVISVYSSHEGKGSLLCRRTLYFDEQSPEHIENFCRAFAYDAHYRVISLNGSAHWCRVARLYDTNAHIIREEEQLPDQLVQKTCKELFHFLRRDLSIIEHDPAYQREMRRIDRNRETALTEALRLLVMIPGVEIASACQGSSSLCVNNRTLYLPSCHSRNACVQFKNVPTSFLHYLQSGPLGQQHLAIVEPGRIRSTKVAQNGSFIRQLTAATRAFVQKRKIVDKSSSSRPGR